MSARVVDVGNVAIMGLAQRAAREDVCRREARSFLDAMEKQNLVRWGYQEYTAICEHAGSCEDGGPGSMSSTYLELGRGTGGIFGGFLRGLWSAGDDMLRVCATTWFETSGLMLRCAIVETLPSTRKMQ